MRYAFLVSAFAALLATSGKAAQLDPTPAEIELANLVNDYRRANGLPPVPLSRSLTLVAERHVRDLDRHRPDTGSDSRGLPCNAHSWSSAGDWTPVCYTPDHHYRELMWNKPREITRGAYDGNGYEIAVGSGGFAMTPEVALRQWRGSAAHNGVILQQGPWGEPWRAMGVGLYGGYAVIWFGREPDRGP